MIVSAVVRATRMGEIKPKGSHLREKDDIPPDGSKKPIFISKKRRTESEMLADVWKPEKLTIDDGAKVRKRARGRLLFCSFFSN